MSSYHILRTADGLEQLVAGPVRIGRGDECELRLNDPLISRVHARVWGSGRRLYLTDEGSTNGTFVNDAQVRGTLRLRPDDVVRVGTTRLYVIAGGADLRPGHIAQRDGLWIPAVFLGTLAVLAGLLALVAYGGDFAARITRRLTEATSQAEVEPLGPEGGAVAGPTGVVLLVPEGALAAPAAVGISPVEDAPPLPGGMTAAGGVYRVAFSDGVRLAEPAEVALPVERVAGVEDDCYAALRWDGARWAYAGGRLRGDMLWIDTTSDDLLTVAACERGQFATLAVQGGWPHPLTVHPQGWKPAAGSCPVSPGAFSLPPSAGSAAASRREVRLPAGAYAGWCVEWQAQGSTYHTITDFPLTLPADGCEPGDASGCEPPVLPLTLDGAAVRTGPCQVPRATGGG